MPNTYKYMIEIIIHRLLKEADKRGELWSLLYA